MSVALNGDVSAAVHDVINHFDFILSRISNSALKLEKQKVLLKTDIQTCINHDFHDNLKNSIKKILIDHCFLAEKHSPGSFTKTLLNVKKILKDQNLQDFDGQIFHPNLDDFEKIINSFCKDEFIANICSEAIKLSGFGGKISIEKSLNSATSIEVIDGYVFSHENYGIPSTKLIKPKVLCIDGYIESVSEVNLLFEGAVNLKHPLVLITRGMHDDVLNTIKVNRNRGTMFVYPIKISFDINGINTIVDISNVIGKDPISCNLGQLISSTKVEDSIEVDEIVIAGNSLSIKNSRTRNNVNIHIKNLIEKRKDSIKDVEELLTTRIKSLSGNCVVVRLPDDSNYIKNSQMIDYVLRSVKSMLDFGVIILDDEIELYGSYKLSKELSKKFVNIITNIYAYLD
jgi:chaperonin GroEL (HSP60 family)